MQYFKKTMTLQEVKKAYRQAAIKLHPDKGGDIQEMQKLNNEFEIAFALAKKYNPEESGTAGANETAANYRRQFYTANGWQGSRYDRTLTTKDIAKIMREYVKNVYPTYRFSITTTVRSIYISLMEYPVELTNRDMLLHYYYTEPTIRHDGETQTDIENGINYFLETVNCGHTFFPSGTWLNPIIAAVLQDVENFMNSYNYDDSDAMIDYFDSNFFGTVHIGKSDKPAKFVKRTARISPTKQRKDTKQISA